MKIHPDIAQLNFGLYGLAGSNVATQEAQEIIQRFVNDVQAWEAKHRELGSCDTASREKFAVNMGWVLGLKGYADR